MTLVGRDEAGRSREFRLSRYADGAGWDVTTGHPRQPPPGEGHLGRLLTDDDVRNCLLCHTTAARPAGGRAGPEAADRGIGCESCHGPGGNHLQAVASHVLLPAIARPRLATAAQVVALCGRCHGPLGKTVTAADPFAVRFPAVGLTWSRCYTESGGALDCRPATTRTATPRRPRPSTKPNASPVTDPAAASTSDTDRLSREPDARLPDLPHAPRPHGHPALDVHRPSHPDAPGGPGYRAASEAEDVERSFTPPRRAGP